MDIADKIESAVGAILPVFAAVPEFTADNVPKSHAIYSITEKGAEYGDGGDNAAIYYVSLGVFTEYPDFALYRRIKAAMRSAGFGYESGGMVQSDGEYPYSTHYYLDFSGVDGDV